MKEQDFIRKKRAIYTGLQPYLKDKELMDALILWENRYSNTPMFSVRYFVADLAKQLNHRISCKTLNLQLVTTLTKPDEELLPDPSNAIAAYKKRHAISNEAQYSLPELEAFQVLLDKLLRGVRPDQAKDINQFVARNLHSLAISSDLKAAVVEWMTRESYSIRLPRVETSQLRRIINLFYVGFCEYLGPPKADALLAQSIHSLKHNGGAIYSELFNKLL